MLATETNYTRPPQVKTEIWKIRRCKMIDLGSLKLGIKVDSGEAKQELDNVKNKTEKVGSSLTSKLGSAAKVAAKGIAVAGTACVAAGAAIVALVESTREYRAEQAKLQTAFETAGFSAEAAKGTYTELNGILGDSGQATEAANHLAKLCDTEEQLAQWTDICAGVYGTFGDSIPIEGLTEAANETAKTGQLTGSLADALNWAGISEDEFQAKLDSCSSEQERQKLITDTLTESYKDAADQYKETAGDIINANKANAAMQDSMASFGAMLEPLTNSVKMFAAEGLQALSEKAAPLVQKAVEWITANMPKIEEVVSNVFSVVGSVIDAIVPVIEALMETIGTLVKQSQESGTAINKVWEFIKTVINSAINIIKAVLGAFSALLKGDWKALWDNVKIIVSEIWEVIKNLIKLALDAVVGIIKGIASALWEAAKFVFGKIKDGFVAVWDTITSWLEEKVQWIVDTVKGIGTKLKDAAKNALNNLLDGFKDAWTAIKEWIDDKVGWITDAWNGVKDFFGGVGGKDGSHRTGLREVPYDGYIAELHKGEMVLTAAEADRYQRGITSGGNGGVINNVTVNNYSPKALTEAESARQYRKAQRELALGF